MSDALLAFDLGTGGNKASLYDVQGKPLATAFFPYETHYPRAGWHEQRPDDWWKSVVAGTRALVAQPTARGATIRCLAISGHSLGCVPLAADGRLLRQATPIWSDHRATAQAEEFFRRVDRAAWYRRTGNGFPPAHYTIFKILWYRQCEPEMFAEAAKIVGTKDYINFRLTGRIATDHSYASGSGAYDLLGWHYADDLLAAADLPRSLLPEIVPATEILGPLTAAAAKELGLPSGIPVACGGVDNSCMALGAKAIADGRIYASLGSSMWIAASSAAPLLDEVVRPYVFTHVVPKMFTSAVAIFSGGTALRWVRDHLWKADHPGHEAGDPYDRMMDIAAQSPPGSRHLLFNPSLGGGSSLDPTPHLRGAFLGLDLGHTQAEILRAAIEGITLNLRLALDELRGLGNVGNELVVVGGASRSPFWRQMFADVFEMNILKTNVGQDAGSLGAAAVAAVACGLWPDFSPIDRVHAIEAISRPVPRHVAIYRKLLPIFREARSQLGKLSDQLATVEPF